MKARLPYLRFPLVTIGICLLIVAGYLLPLEGISLEVLYLVPQRVTLWSPLTSCFLHASPAHLLDNLLWLLIFGTLLERATRRYQYALVLIVGGIIASLVQAGVILVSQPERAHSPIVGASGMVSAVIGASAVRFFAEDLQVGRVAVPSLWVIALWFILQLIGAMRMLAEGGGTVGYWGHLGGFVAGLLLALLLRIARGHFAQLVRTAQAQGDILQALRIAEGWCQAEPWSLQAHLTAARLAQQAGDDRLAASYYQQALFLCERRNRIQEGVNIFLEVPTYLRSLPPQVRLKWALHAAQAGHPQEAQEALLQLADTATGTPEGENALLQSAQITLQQIRQHDEAMVLLQRFLKEYPHSPLIPYARDLLRQAKEMREEKTP